MKLPWSWVAWLAAVLVALTITRNPLYLLIVLGCVFFVELVLNAEGSRQRYFSPWKLSAWILVLATLFNTFTSHFGETVLFIIPGRLPLISGNVTLEAVEYGTINGLILVGMLMSFTVLNLALPVRDLISLIPRAFYPVAVVTSIAVTYLPTTLRQFQQIREAQAVRGHQMRTLRDWLPLLMPLLVGGLEHAMQLAEAMTARGFASSKPTVGKQRITPRLLMLVGVVVLAAGWWTQLAAVNWKGWLVILVGALLVSTGLWLTGTHAHITAYHHTAWSWQDALVIASALVVIGVCVLPIPGAGREALYYDPYPRLTLPPFNPSMGLLLLLLLPGVMALKRLNDADL